MNRRLRQHFQQIAKEGWPRGLAEFLDCGIVLGLRLAGVQVESADKFGRVGVQLRAFAETVEAKVGKIFAADRIGSGMHLQVVLQHV